MPRVVSRLNLLAALGLAAYCISPTAARAEIQFGVYSGYIYTHPSDVFYSRPGLPSTTFSSVIWDGNPMTLPPYWGVFATYWFDPGSSWGVQIDYAHAKMYARLNSGTPVVSSTFSTLEFTDGLNLLTVNALYRWHFSGFRPFVGAGAGIAIPHVEVTTTGFPATFEYQVTGFAAVALAGIDYSITESLSLLLQYKFSYTPVAARLTGGGSLSTDALTHHFMLGLMYSFR